MLFLMCETENLYKMSHMEGEIAFANCLGLLSSERIRSDISTQVFTYDGCTDQKENRTASKKSIVN